MYGDYATLCRVCMSPGAREIFVQQSENSLKLLEKLRYVSMMKINENDDLPKSLCDMCVVHLNVAYDFKRLAVENDTKLRQYYIENGLNSNNNVAILQANINPSNSRNFEENVLTSITSTKEKVLPIYIKTEEDNSIISKESAAYPSSISINNNSIRVKDFANLKEPSMVFINNDSFNLNSSSEADGPSTSAVPENNFNNQNTNLRAQSKKSVRVSNKKRIVEGRLGDKSTREIRNLNIDLNNWNYINAATTRLQRCTKNIINIAGENKNKSLARAKKNRANGSLDILDRKFNIEVLNQHNLQTNTNVCNALTETNTLLMPKAEPANEIKTKSKIFR